MNANELADWFRDAKTFWQPDQLLEWGYEAETMLRQQAKRIEELEIELEKKIERERYKSELINLLIKNIVDACNETLRMAAEK